MFIRSPFNYPTWGFRSAFEELDRMRREMDRLFEGFGIEISVDRNRITIRGEKKTEKEKKDHGYYHMERHYGAFHRSIPLPLEVESDKVDAEFNNGVLTVSLPKSAATRERTRKIPVRTK
jgi:hypothetical protein